MNVLMFGWELPPHNSGGLGVACYGLAKGLSQYGVKISFALPRRLQISVPFMELIDDGFAGVEVTAINSLLRAYAGMSDYKLDRWSNEYQLYADGLYQEAMRYGEVASIWSRQKPHEVIHGHDWMTYPAAMRAHATSGKPWIAHIHATEHDRAGANANSLIAEIEYEGLNKADRVIAVSQYTKQVVNRYYGVPNDRIVVVHNGIESQTFSPLQVKKLFPNDKIVLFVGRLTYQKGVSYFLKAAEKVLAHQPNTIFLVVGHGDMYEQLILEAADLGIANRVLFPGFLSGEPLRQCYAMSDVFVMPSVSEPYGIVALEALAAGVPAILSKQSGVAETISNSFKVDFWDTELMADMILTSLTYPKLASTLSTAARQEASQLTWQKAAEKTIAVYQQVAGC